MDKIDEVFDKLENECKQEAKEKNKIFAPENSPEEKDLISRAKDIQTRDEFVTLLDEVMTGYVFDYGSIVNICAAMAYGAFLAVNRADCGGISGFQAGCVMWRFIHHLGLYNPGDHLRIQNYSDLLYPQSEDKFKEIPAETWVKLKEEARGLLEGQKTAKHKAHPEVVAHWKQVAAGKVPFDMRVGT